MFKDLVSFHFTVCVLIIFFQRGLHVEAASWCSDSKEADYNAGDSDLIPGLKILREEWQPLQFSCS